MTQIKKLVLDVLKPHQPNALEFATALADLGDGLAINVAVEEVDEKTESIIVLIEGENIDYDLIAERIKELGASVHSIDEVEVVGAKNKMGE
ncbi:MAG TPA: hypothetical protein EYH06_11870 [Chromatiales bacterium]|nr:hypothetical protein [Thiotrichales bacterium]HIP69260.1 hypothetical protein [Chromatiales bacterium]